MKSIYIKNFLLFFLTALIIAFFIPKNIPSFNYKYAKGKIWNYETLFAPFDFLIRKSAQEIEKETKDIENNKRLYYKYDTFISEKIKKKFEDELNKNSLYNAKLISIFNNIYRYGILEEDNNSNDHTIVSIIKNNEEEEIVNSSIFNIKSAIKYFTKEIDLIYSDDTKEKKILKEIFITIITPNLFFDNDFSNLILKEKKEKIVLSKGKIIKDQKLIEKGQIITADIYDILNSLSHEYKTNSLSIEKGILVIVGYTILILSIFAILFLYILFFSKDNIFFSLKKVLIILVLILLSFFLSIFFLSVDYLNKHIIFLLPMSIVPIITRTFFNHKISIFLHIIILLLISIYLDNNFHFLFINTLIGVISIFGVKEIHKRANMFINVSIISISYIVLYSCFLLIQNGEIISSDLEPLLLFFINGMLTLFSLPMIYIFEKIFREYSDITLLELSDTNNFILRELSLKAPGTFQHSLQVANIAENISRQIKNTKPLLARVGALYHDIGKLINPEYFIENQYSENPHDNLPNKKSAEIVINHVYAGIKLADKYNIPYLVKDFIKTHHGTSLAYFFYKKEVELYGEDTVDKKDFSYSGPLPFSKEMAIVMISDSIEAASKSITNPTEEDLKNIIEKIINNLINTKQFSNVNITFKELDTAKNISFESLKTIYKGRIKYPE